MIPLIQRFLVITAIVCTVALSILEVLILLPGSQFGQRLFGTSNWWLAVGFPIGAWLGIMVSLAMTYALTEIARASREKH